MCNNWELCAYAVKNLYQFTSFKECFKKTLYKDSDLHQFLYQIYTRLPVYTTLPVLHDFLRQLYTRTVIYTSFYIKFIQDLYQFN